MGSSRDPRDWRDMDTPLWIPYSDDVNVLFTLLFFSIFLCFFVSLLILVLT